MRGEGLENLVSERLGWISGYLANRQNQSFSHVPVPSFPIQLSKKITKLVIAMHIITVAKTQFTEITNFAVPDEVIRFLVRVSIRPTIHVIDIADITRNTPRWLHWMRLT